MEYNHRLKKSCFQQSISLQELTEESFKLIIQYDSDILSLNFLMHMPPNVDLI